MPRSRPIEKARSRAAYHHGDLSNAALSVAQEILRAEGLERLSVRRVAGEIGVSPMALYNHFSSKEELLAGLAEAGFERLRTEMLAAAPPDLAPLERLERGGVAYVVFAVENSREFALMFGGALGSHPRITQAAHRAFTILVECLADCEREGLLRGSAVAAERAIWSAAHGYASLWNSVPAIMRGDREQIRSNAEEMFATILRGL